MIVAGHRFGGTEFRVGPREFGHVHEWGMVDVDAEVASMDLPEAIIAAFERRSAS